VPTANPIAAESQRAMHAYPRVPFAAVAAAHRDMDEARGAVADPECVGGAVVAEEGVVAEREDRRPPAAVGAESLVADREDATMAWMQTPGLHAPLDRPADSPQRCSWLNEMKPPCREAARATEASGAL
jgi:hypothetical protein